MVNTSRLCTETLTYEINNGQDLNINDHIINLKSITKRVKILKDNYEKMEGERIVQFLPESKKNTLIRIVNGNESQWLTVTPISAGHGCDSQKMNWTLA